MTEQEIARINELYHKQKQVGLSPEEKEEQTKLRKEFIATFRRNIKSQLDQISIEEEDGTIVNLGERHDKKYNKK